LKIGVRAVVAKVVVQALQHLTTAALTLESVRGCILTCKGGSENVFFDQVNLHGQSASAPTRCGTTSG
jgi:hypothetical protein